MEGVLHDLEGKVGGIGGVARQRGRKESNKVELLATGEAFKIFKAHFQQKLIIEWASYAEVSRKEEENASEIENLSKRSM